MKNICLFIIIVLIFLSFGLDKYAFSLDESAASVEQLCTSVDSAFDNVKITATLTITTSNSLYQRLKEGGAKPRRRGRTTNWPDLQGKIIQERNLEIICRDGVVTVLHDIHTNPFGKPLRHQEVYNLKDIGSEQNDVLVPDGMRTPTQLTFGRGLSYYIENPVYMVENASDNQKYNVTFKSTDNKITKVLATVDKEKGFCWTDLKSFDSNSILRLIATASDYRKVDGTWFPFQVEFIDFHDNGDWDQRRVYKIDSIESIQESALN